MLKQLLALVRSCRAANTSFGRYPVWLSAEMEVFTFAKYWSARSSCSLRAISFSAIQFSLLGVDDMARRWPVGLTGQVEFGLELADGASNLRPMLIDVCIAAHRQVRTFQLFSSWSHACSSQIIDLRKKSVVVRQEVKQRIYKPFRSLPPFFHFGVSQILDDRGVRAWAVFAAQGKPRYALISSCFQALLAHMCAKRPSLFRPFAPRGATLPIQSPDAQRPAARTPTQASAGAASAYGGMVVGPSSDCGGRPTVGACTGIVTHRQRPSPASRVIFATLEDETGTTNIIFWSSIAEEHRRALRGSMLLTVDGTWQPERGVQSFVAAKLTDHTHLLQRLRVSSRDFQ